MKIRVADYISARCAEAGASHVFLVTGGGAMHLNDAFTRNKSFQPVCFHHEQAAAIAAESYFRLTNKWAVLNLTTGPGGINALNGVYGAYVDSLGLMVISGQVKRETYLKNYQIPMRQLGDQEVDIVSMARPIVKYATVLQDPEQVRVVMDKAIYLASSGRPGPVWVDVPIDVQSSLIEVGALKGFDVTNTELLLQDPDITLNTRNEISLLGKCNLNDHIKIIVEKLKSSKRPVLFVGNGIRLSGAHDEFLRLVKELNIPVVTGWNAHDVLTNDNSCYAGRPGTVGDRAGNFTVQNADFVLVLGCRLNIRQISYNWKSFASRAWLAMVDIDAAELEKPTLKINLKVHADLKQFIAHIRAALSDYSPPPSHSEYMAWCAARVKKYPTVLAEYRKMTEPVNPYYFMEVLFDTLKANDVIVAGNGSACVISFQAAQLKNGQRLYTNSGSASMGYDLPAAIGASIALGKKKVICLAGDGSIMMNLQELQTIVGYDLPVKVIVLNNGGYHSIRQTQQAYFSDNLFGIGPADGVSLPDFVRVGESFGIQSIRVTDLMDWNSEEVKGIMESSKAALIEVVLDKNQPFSPKLASRKLPDGTMLSPSLEDMAPFLGPDEIARNVCE